MNRKKSHSKITFGFFVCVKTFNSLKNIFIAENPNRKSLFRLLGGGTVRWGAERSGMKKVLLGESETFSVSDDIIIKNVCVYNMDSL